jgi:hypothetical protein
MVTEEQNERVAMAAKEMAAALAAASGVSADEARTDA